MENDILEEILDYMKDKKVVWKNINTHDTIECEPEMISRKDGKIGFHGTNEYGLDCVVFIPEDKWTLLKTTHHVRYAEGKTMHHVKITKI